MRKMIATHVITILAIASELRIGCGEVGGSVVELFVEFPSS